MKIDIKQVETILYGIDQLESECEQGWWETSFGAEYGAEKLQELIDYLDSVNEE